RPLAAAAGCPMTQFALAGVLREPNVASAIVGASRPEQLDENAAASGLAIDPALFTKAEAIVAGAAPQYGLFLPGTGPGSPRCSLWLDWGPKVLPKHGFLRSRRVETA